MGKNQFYEGIEDQKITTAHSPKCEKFFIDNVARIKENKKTKTNSFNFVQKF